MTTGQIDHKIAARLKFDDFDAILAIVYLKADAEYALGEGARPVDRRFFEQLKAQFYL